jgi:hypothetical protein
MLGGARLYHVALWAWRTTADGYVEVDRQGIPSLCPEFSKEPLPPAGTWERLLLPTAPIYTNALAKATQWADLAAGPAAVEQMPMPWVLAFVYGESGGNPNAELVEPSGAVGVGLMALTAQPAAFQMTWGITFEEAHDPAKSLQVGVGYMGKLQRAGNLDFPQLASAYNGGTKAGMPHPSTKSRWGIREYCWGEPPQCCHIERMTRAQNTIRQQLGVTLPVPGNSKQPPVVVEPPVLAGTVSATRGTLVFIGFAAVAYLCAKWCIGRP